MLMEERSLRIGQWHDEAARRAAQRNLKRDEFCTWLHHSGVIRPQSIQPPDRLSDNANNTIHAPETGDSPVPTQLSAAGRPMMPDIRIRLLVARQPKLPAWPVSPSPAAR
jgi:hypothetical protein